RGRSVKSSATRGRFGVRLRGIENNESAVGKNMKGRVTIGLVGDRNDSVPAHLAIPLALENAAAELGITAAYEWVPTDRIRSASRVAAFDGLWCVPASPYRSMEGALLAIRCAREG